jgi:glycosyltransferase involved in cell wall biosynthesis
VTVPRVLVVGPLPPPVNGMTRMTEVALSQLADHVLVDHLDISDHRAIGAVGRFDALNLWLAVRHGLLFARALLHRPRLCYLPIAHNRLGFLRDSLFLLVARLGRVPVIVHFHGQGFGAYRRRERAWMRALIRLALPPTVHAIVLGTAMRCDFAGLLPDSHVHCVPNGVPDSGVGGDAGARAAVVLFLSHLGSRKGVFEFVEVASRVAEAVPEAEFVLAGEWYRADERRRALDAIARTALKGRVRFVGAVSEAEKASLLASTAVLLFPARDEGQPLVLIEALAAGTPVVSTRVGAIPETINDGCDGFLVDRDDLEGAADRVVRLLCDTGLRARVGAAARSRYESDFTASTFGARLAAVIDAVLAQRSVAHGRNPVLVQRNR